MTTSYPAKPPIISRVIEFVLMLAMFAGLARLIKFFHYQGYLPAPFVFDVSDTFMDWFNTAYYAHNNGGYSAWHTIYAPLSFVVLKVLGLPACYANGPKDARDCDVVGITMILIVYLLCVVVASIAFYKRDRSTAFFRSVGFGLGLPLLYALERGNLVMIAFIPFIMMFGGLIKSRVGIASAAAFIINMKSYLLFPVLMLAIKRDWRMLELCGFATIGLYLVTMFIMGAGTPFELAANLKIWFNAMSGVVWDQIYYSTTYKPFLQFDERGYPIREFIAQQTVDIAKTFIQIELVFSRGVALLCIALSWFYPRAISSHRLAFFIIMQSFVVQNPGGYAIAFITFLVLLERWDNFATGLAIFATYILSIPSDYLLGVFYSYDRAAWLSNRVVDSAYGISLGALFRPGLLLILLWALAIDSLITFHRAIKSGPPQFTLARRPAIAADLKPFAP